MKRAPGPAAVLAVLTIAALQLAGGHAPRPRTGEPGDAADPRIPPPVLRHSIVATVRAQARLRHTRAVLSVGGFVCAPGIGLGQQLATSRAPKGTLLSTTVRSAAVGRTQNVLVYLPPGYGGGSSRRYPVLYLLHGFPGTPGNMSVSGGAPEHEDALVAAGRMKPTILVMPSGSPSVTVDTEWANGAAPGSAWETFVARDLVGSIDRTYRTIASGSARGIARLSSGGYGAINIALHHPGEFGVVEAWSGYTEPDPTVVGADPASLAYNDPAIEIRRVADQARADGMFLWFYTGNDDRFCKQNVAFDAELTSLRIAHAFSIFEGSHDWALWRGALFEALSVASRRFGAT